MHLALLLPVSVCVCISLSLSLLLFLFVSPSLPLSLPLPLSKPPLSLNPPLSTYLSLDDSLPEIGNCSISLPHSCLWSKVPTSKPPPPCHLPCILPPPTSSPSCALHFSFRTLLSTHTDRPTLPTPYPLHPLRISSLGVRVGPSQFRDETLDASPRSCIYTHTRNGPSWLLPPSPPRSACRRTDPDFDASLP